jgi:hypothetical protein
MIPLKDLPLFWQGRANALRIIAKSDEINLECALVYEECIKELRIALAAFKNSLDSRLNNYLCEMKPGYDDSIVGFNEAWDIMRAAMDGIDHKRGTDE